MRPILVILALFAFLAISAATGFPGAVFPEPMPRGMRALEWIVELATSPFGTLGGAALFAALGTVGAGLALRRQRKASASATATAGDVLEASPPAAPPAQRRRPLVSETPIELIERGDYGAFVTQLIEANAPPPLPDGPLDPAILAARVRPIVFRRPDPRSLPETLSFFGGAPMVPPGFVWPRDADSGAPLHFVMQWDCRDLASLDATGLLPNSGVLWFFLDFTWGKADCFRFLHAPGPAEGWEPAAPPNDLGPILADQGAHQMAGCSPKVDDPDRFVPRLMPYAPFVPVAFAYPEAERDEEADDAERLFWHDRTAAPALLAIEAAGGDVPPIRHIGAPRPAFARPFAAFPHDMGAIRVLAAFAVKELSGPHYIRQRKSVLADLEPEVREARFDAWLAEATELYLFAAARPMTEATEQVLADQVWAWIAALEPVFALAIDGLAKEAVNLSIGYQSDARAAIPQEWWHAVRDWHALAHEYDRDEHPDHSQPDAYKRHEEKKARGELAIVRELHAVTPAHMFGPPSYVQGDVEELMDDHLLLLELPSGGGPAHRWGDGVLQFLIRPEDLAARRFERVTAVISGY